ncbi:WD domain G-beta repeat protein [Trichostrongylus colubriformis]|uniref:WD domain G-beta repeat protein n=1 Tax=Trichostrongylus colubriformis TaxID=6319 RepID=A0AAN8IS12_TRICO
MSFTDVRNIHVKGHITVCTDRSGSSKKTLFASEMSCGVVKSYLCGAMSFTDVRNIHVKGHITVCTDRSGSSKKFITCGTDGTVYIWDEKTVTEREAAEIKTVGDATHSCCAWNGDNVFVGLTTTDLLTGVDKKIVGQCSLDDLESCRQLFTFSLEVSSIDASENYVVAGGSDYTVKKVNLKEGGQYDRIDTNGEVLSIAIDPKEIVYAVACCDGSVTIFDIATNEKLRSLDKTFTSFGDIGVENPRHTLTWSKDGSELFVPSQGCVKAVVRDGWECSNNSFKSSGTSLDVFSTSCLSKCGRYLCSSTMSNKIVIWNVADRSVLSQTVYNKRPAKAIISCTKFCPFNERDIVIVDVEEGFCVLENATPLSAQSSGKVTDSAVLGDVEDEEDNDEDESSIPTHELLYNEAEEDGDTKMSVDIGEIKRKYGFGDDGSGILDDYGFTVSKEATNKPGQPISHDLATSVPAPQVVSYQPPTIPSFFVSGASPDHLTQRYLKWNAYGIVRGYSEEDGSSIEISFHDASIHPTIVLDNGTTEYVMADLSDQAIALASKAEEKGEQSELLVIHISSWDSESRRWSTKLPKKEIALDVLVSREIICVVTSKRNLRVFTLTGTQRHIITHPSPILTTACFGSKIAICSISGGDYYEKEKKSHFPNYQHNVSVYDVDSKMWHRNTGSGAINVNLPVAKKERLCWLGYTNHGQLVSMDSSYTVNLLTPAGFWIPIFDGSTEIMNKSDAIWPIAVTDGRQRQIRYLHCKGSKYPLIAIKMAPFIAPWTLPYCAPESDKSKLEQELFLNEVQQSEVRRTGSSSELMELASSHLQSLIKLFALACKSERDGRAAEMASLVTSAKGIQMMCNYAAKLKKSTLADKVAARGRENVSLNETVSDSHHPLSEATPTPRRISIKRKIGVDHDRPIFMEDKGDTSAAPLSDFGVDEQEEDRADFPQPSHSQQTDDSLLNETLIPAQKMSRNPFKRSPSSSADTSSLFEPDSFFASGRKRLREDEPPKLLTSTSKQQKLSFGSSVKGKENARTAYSLWMESNEETLHGMFSGNPEDFVKFCAQQFRMLPALEKKEWKARAEKYQQ